MNNHSTPHSLTVEVSYYPAQWQAGPSLTPDKYRFECLGIIKWAKKKQTFVLHGAIPDKALPKDSKNLLVEPLRWTLEAALEINVDQFRPSIIGGEK